uniref:Uncharacterized protein n=1 Tax=Monopterus albus TaxID=43700 RepID=A0A3Q3IC55_MONAL
MSWIPLKIGQPKKQTVSKTDQMKKLHKDMKKNTEADLVQPPLGLFD